MKVTDYKGHEIHYDSFTKQFQAEEKSFSTQTEAEKYIDRLVAAEKAQFRRIPVIFVYYNDPLVGEVTSIIDDVAWFTSSDGKRQKAKLSCFFHATPENLTRLERIQEFNRQIKVLQQDRNDIKFDSPLSEGR